MKVGVFVKSIIVIPISEGILYWAGDMVLTPIKSRAKVFPSKLGAEHELNHLPTLSETYKNAYVEYLND